MRFDNLTRLSRSSRPGSRRQPRSLLRVEQFEDRVTPAITVGIDALPALVEEGDSITISATTDAGAPTFEWTVTKDGADFDTSTDADYTFTPDDDGTYVISLTVTGTDPIDPLVTGTATDTETVTVENTPPVVTLPGDATIDEGGTFTGSVSVADDGTTDTWTVTVDYGDGSPVETLATDSTETTFDLSHVYATSGDFTVTVTATDDDGGVGSDTLLVSAVNVAPTVEISGPSIGVRGQPLPFTLNATDSESDMAAGFTFDIDWGDGSADEQVVGESGTVASHVYTENGTYTITVTATDQDGAASEPVTFTVEIRTAALIDDPLNPGDTLLAVGGTEGADSIVINPAGGLKVRVGGESVGRFSGADRIAVYGMDGNDNIQIAGSIKVPAWLDGGAGDDRLKGGKASDMLQGGEGNDNLNGGQGLDILIGGAGADRLNGGPGGDILLGGLALLDEAGLFAIGELWGDGASAADLSGPDGFTTEGTPTVEDDGEADQLQGASGKNWFLAASDTDDILGNTKRSVVDDISAAAEGGGDSGNGNGGNGNGENGNGGNGNGGNGKGGNGKGGNGKGNGKG